jgi:hypothetical protein
MSSEGSLRVGKLRGWIPNVAGRLSFKHIGDTRFPSPCTTLNFPDQQGYAMVIAQQRTTEDQLVAPWFYEYCTGFDLSPTFVFVGVSQPEGTDKTGKLVGKVFVFFSKIWKKPPPKTDQSEVKRSPKQVIGDLVRQIAREPDDYEIRGSKLRQHIDIIKGELLLSNAFVVDVCVFRSGLVELEPGSLGDKLLVKDSSGSKVCLSESPKMIRFYCDQAFFFLKDIAHKHRFHAPRADNIVNLSDADTDAEWAKNIHYKLHRKVVSLRRDHDPLSLMSALGVLTYLKAFERILIAEKAGPRDLFETSTSKDGLLSINNYNYAEMADSIKASLEGAKWRRIQLNILVVAFPTLLFYLVSASGKDSAIQKSVGDVISGMISSFEAALIFFISLFVFSLWMYGVFRLRNFRVVNNIKRIHLALSPKKRGFLDVIIAFVFLITLGISLLVYFGYIGHNTFLAASVGDSNVVWYAVLLSVLAIFLVYSLFPYLAVCWDGIRQRWERRGR